MKTREPGVTFDAGGIPKQQVVECEDEKFGLVFPSSFKIIIIIKKSPNLCFRETCLKKGNNKKSSFF